MLSTVNEKKIPTPSCLLADTGARRERSPLHKPLIACEKARPGGDRVTVILAEPIFLADLDTTATTTLVDPSSVGPLLPPGAVVDVVIRLEDWGPAASRLLASLRDRANRPVVVHLGETVDDRLKMIALGYRAAEGNDPVYVFDINDYKETPDWLSPRNWANPEMWDKYRW